MSERSLQQPMKKIIKDVKKNPFEATFTLTPIEPGYGNSIGNPMRRALLASIEGYAITQIKLPDTVAHQFSTIPGIVEDIKEIIMNLRQIRFKSRTEHTGDPIHIEIEGQETFRAKDMERFTPSFEVTNPDFVICHMDPGVHLILDVIIQKGKGYMPAKQIEERGEILPGYLPVDAIFSPIRKAAVVVAETRVADRTDYEKVILDVETDGTLTAEEAIQAAAENLIKHFALFLDKDISTVRTAQEAPEQIDKELLKMRKLLRTPLDELNLSSRVSNSLSDKNIRTLGDMVQLEKSQFLKFKSIGKKSIMEIMKLLEDKKLQFGMDISAYKAGTKTHLRLN